MISKCVLCNRQVELITNPDVNSQIENCKCGKYSLFAKGNRACEIVVIGRYGFVRSINEKYWQLAEVNGLEVNFITIPIVIDGNTTEEKLNKLMVLL